MISRVCREVGFQTSETSIGLESGHASPEDGDTLRRLQSLPEVGLMSSTLNCEPNGTARTGIPERDDSGRFALGNQLARGHGGGANDLARWRRLWREATTEQDALDVWRALLTEAKAGNVLACHEVLDRLGGKVPPGEPEKAQGVGEVLALQWSMCVEPAHERIRELEAELAALRPPEPATPPPGHA